MIPFSVWLTSSLGPPMLLQIALFHSFHGWVIVHYIYIFCIHIFFIRSSAHLGCFHAFIVTWSAMNTGEHVSLQVRGFPQIYARSGIAGSYGNSVFLVFWRTSILFSIVAAPIYIPTNNVGRFPFLHHLSSICYL